jgi:hypothetical protein
MPGHSWYIARTWDLSDEQAASIADTLLKAALPGPELTALASEMIGRLEATSPPGGRSYRRFRRALRQRAHLGSEKVVLGCHNCGRDYRSAAGGEPCVGGAEEVAQCQN